jgi:hypothetical protein
MQALVTSALAAVSFFRPVTPPLPMVGVARPALSAAVVQLVVM